MAIWNGLTETGAVVPIQVDDQGRVVVSGGGGLPSQVYGTAKIWGRVGESGQILAGDTFTVTRLETGKFEIQFNESLPNDSYIVLAMAEGVLARFAHASDYYQGYCNIWVREHDGTMVDNTFDFAIFNFLPTDVTPLILPLSALNDIQRLKDAVGLDSEEPIS